MFIGCPYYYKIATSLLHVHASKVHDYYYIILYIQVDGVLSKYNCMDGDYIIN